MRKIRSIILSAAALAFTSPAVAAWHRASSPHFVIYSDEDPAKLQAFATKLERFDSAVRVARGMDDPPVGDGNRLTVFVVRDISAVEKLKRSGGSNKAGFYLPRASGSVAVVPRSTPMRSELQPDVIFQHEYAHHLMFADLETPVPTWLVEGFAEFYSTANVEKDGSVGLGEAATHRGSVFRSTRDQLPLDSLLSGERLRTGFDRASLYARGWLLTHYLTFEPTRRGQLETYLAEFAKGRSSLEAARMTFGSLGQLEHEMDEYLRKDRFPYLTLPATRIKAAAVTVERLGPGAEAAMPLYMRLQARTEASAEAQAAEARALAATHPDDPLVAMALAEAEWVTRNYRAAEAGADKAVALMPQSSEAHIWKGRALLARAQAKEPSVTFANVRGWFNRANRLDPENPEPLLYFYRTFQAEGVRPTANAIAALHYAAELAPQDLGLRIQSANQYLLDGKPAQARERLVPVAYHPHGGPSADIAKRMIASIDTGDKKGSGEPVITTDIR